MEPPLVLPSRTHHELTYSTRCVGSPIGPLRGEAFVVVVVAVEHDVGAGLIEVVPEVFHLGAVSVLVARAEQRYVPKRQRATRGVLLKILSQPLFLRGSLAAAANRRTLTVQGDDVPGSEIKAVITATRVARRLSKVSKVAGRTRRVILVITRRGTGAIFVPSPGFVITAEVRIAAVGIREVANGQDCAWNLIQKLCRRFRAGCVRTIDDIPGRDHSWIGSGRRIRFLRLFARLQCRSAPM